MGKNILYLVDGTSVCYRSFFALKLSTSQGLPTGAVYGVYQTFKKLFSRYEPAYLGVCFDVSRKTHRTEKFRDYKINRPPLPDGLKTQLPLIKQLLAAMGIAMIEQEGFEADDLIASLCHRALRENYEVVIVSSDKDMLQLLCAAGVRYYNYHKNVLMDREHFFKEYGFKPEAIVDYLSLTGDASDNIPGARGIGRVGATHLIQEFGSIDAIYDNLAKIKPKLKSLLESHRQEVYLSKDLITLAQPALSVQWQDLKRKSPDTPALYKLFKELEFKALLKDIPVPDARVPLEVVAGLPAQISGGASALSLYIDGQTTFVYDPNAQRLHSAELASIKGVLKDPSLAKFTYGLKGQLAAFSGSPADVLAGAIAGVPAGAPVDALTRGWFDVKIAAYVLDSSLLDYSLESLAAHFLKEPAARIRLEHYPYFIHRLGQLLATQLKEQKLDKLFYEVEMPLVTVLAAMQTDGVKIETQVLESLREEVAARSLKAKETCFKLAGRTFNLNSPKQLQQVLFGDLKIKPLKKIKTGYSTNEEVLEILAREHPIAVALLEYRYLAKLTTTYLTPLIDEVAKHAGSLHTQFHQTQTQTGRLSSSSPNLQSVPVKGEFSEWLRRAFVPSFADGVLLSGDYSQIELRILAHLSGDENLIKAFSEDLDIHRYTAHLLFGVGVKAVSDAERTIAKRVNFGIIYGMSDYGLAKELKIDVAAARNFIDDYFGRYRGVKSYIERIYEQVEETGYVETILGRRRLLPDIKSSNMGLREFARRQAVNAPIQGSWADLIKLAMVRIFREFKQRRLRAKLILQIHDELVFDVPESERVQVLALAREHMEGALSLTVPIKVNLKTGKNWGAMQEVNP